MAIAGIAIAGLQVTYDVGQYLKDVAEAPKELARCRQEATVLYGLLLDLLSHINQSQSGDQWFNAVRNLGGDNGPIAQYKKAREQLASKIEKRSEPGETLKAKLLWKFKKRDVKEIFDQMERLKSLIIIALERDYL